MRILVTGGRDLTDPKVVWRELDALLSRHPTLSIIEGGCKSGADTFARFWAGKRGRPCQTVEADWDGIGRGAGMIRNEGMLLVHKPNLVLAFRGGPGTRDMYARAARAGIETLRIGW